MFQGAAALSLDAKGRLAIPARHRDALTADSGHVVLTAHPHGCLLVYPVPAWVPIRDKVLAAPSLDPMSAMFKRWCHDAGLGHLSAHGVRKGLAEVLAEMGSSQYDIMAILGHSEAKTSEVYTRRVERWNLAKTALAKVGKMGVWG